MRCYQVPDMLTVVLGSCLVGAGILAFGWCGALALVRARRRRRRRDQPQHPSRRAKLAAVPTQRP